MINDAREKLGMDVTKDYNFRVSGPSGQPLDNNPWMFRSLDGATVKAVTLLTAGQLATFFFSFTKG
jgi:hypothetical protein